MSDILNPKIADYVGLLKRLICTPSFSREEDKTAEIIFDHLKRQGMNPVRKNNNVWVTSVINEKLPTILLNSHHDTVKPASGWAADPFTPVESEGKLYGLGSNDAGASLVSLMAVFAELSKQNSRPYNLIYAATAEEEVTGKDGIESILPDLGNIDLAIVGEPTEMQMAVAEKGLMVLDCETFGVTGHAARNEGINAIYNAIYDVEKIRNFEFPKKSELLGSVKMSVTMINAGTQHNVVPDSCKFVVDVRTNEFYRNEEALEIISNMMEYSEITPRSTRLNSSYISLDHPIVKRGLSLGLKYFGSPTSSDQMVIPYPSVKIGPGHSKRSHTANEYIMLKEIEEGVEIYLKLLKELVLTENL
jgi:acetylornithine deacetylase